MSRQGSISASSSSAKLRPIAMRIWSRGRSSLLLIGAVLCCVLTASSSSCAQLEAKGQSATLPFSVSNPKNLKWSPEEATRIYYLACQMVARSIRPERPPLLRPGFVLVLGADANETVRIAQISEVRLIKWDPVRFAEAAVVMATRDILKAQDVTNLTRDTLLASRASVTVSELKRQQ